MICNRIYETFDRPPRELLPAFAVIPVANDISKTKYLRQLLRLCIPYVSMTASRLTEEQKRILRDVTYPFLHERMEEPGAPKY